MTDVKMTVGQLIENTNMIEQLVESISDDNERIQRRALNVPESSDDMAPGSLVKEFISLAESVNWDDFQRVDDE